MPGFDEVVQNSRPSTRHPTPRKLFRVPWKSSAAAGSSGGRSRRRRRVCCRAFDARQSYSACRQPCYLVVYCTCMRIT
jgi:hypothetical protein